MKRASYYTLVSLMFCACIALTQADAVLKSLSCPWWKTGSPYVLCDHDSNLCCCRYAAEIAGFPEDAYHDFDKQSESPSDDGCCKRGCCKNFQTMIFLVAGLHFSVRTDDSPPVVEKNQSLVCSDFSRSLFRPPQV